MSTAHVYMSADQFINHPTVSQGLAAQHNSPHVHFQEPLVIHNWPGASNTQEKWPSKISPAVSPIPYKYPVQTTGTQPEKRVVVNLPSAWQE